MSLDDHIAALRAIDGEVDAKLALATRRRLRKSLDRDRRGHRGLVSVGTAVGILLAGTVSWALVTGNLPVPWRTPTPPPAQHAIPDPFGRPEPPPLRHAPVPVPMPVPVLPPPAPPVAPAAPLEALYRKAHDLHFHGRDVAAALAAWDAYLAAEPDGRFAVEARYNRALCLIRLGRLGAARTALLPFANDEVSPPGYRHDEAAELVRRIGLNE